MRRGVGGAGISGVPSRFLPFDAGSAPAASAMNDLPIFPLNTVLFPSGVLPLRVFEARYMDMVRDCLRDGSRFGVCLIAQGNEVSRKPGEAAVPEAVGCFAEILAWDMRDLGVLHIRTVGRERFRILESHVQSNGLVRANVEPIAVDAPAPVALEHRECVALLARLIAELEEKRDTAEAPPEPGALDSFPFHEPYALHEAGWVANRLCEVLPVPLKAKQKLMELESGHERLAIVDTYLRQQKVL